MIHSLSVANTYKRSLGQMYGQSGEVPATTQSASTGLAGSTGLFAFAANMLGQGFEKDVSI